MVCQFYNKKLARKDLNLGEKLYVILSTPNLYNHRLHYDLKSDQFIYEYEKLKSLKKLSPYIYNNLKFRLHPNSFRWAMKERIKQDFDNNKIWYLTIEAEVSNKFIDELDNKLKSIN